jgi:hypothetical protein
MTLLQDDLDRLSSWMDKNYLALNAKKTQFITFGGKAVLKDLPADLSIDLLDQSVTRSNCVKNLGVQMDENLQFDKHVDQVVRSSTRAAFAIRSAVKSLPLSTVEELVRSLIFPILDYCNVVFMSAPHGQIDRIRKAENFAVRLCYGRRKFDSASDIFTANGWLTQKQRAQKQQLSVMHRCLYGPAPAYLTRMVEFSLGSARNGDTIPLRPPRIRQEVGRRRFAYSGAVAWNSLPNHLKLLRHGTFCSSMDAVVRSE